tara:strand:+ start:625 stop:774 length:150 start_codon:yes stop_codon:yes gene_type:complete
LKPAEALAELGRDARLAVIPLAEGLVEEAELTLLSFAREQDPVAILRGP